MTELLKIENTEEQTKTPRKKNEGIVVLSMVFGAMFLHTLVRGPSGAS